MGMTKRHVSHQPNELYCGQLLKLFPKGDSNAVYSRYVIHCETRKVSYLHYLSGCMLKDMILQRVWQALYLYAQHNYSCDTYILFSFYSLSTHCITYCNPRMCYHICYPCICNTISVWSKGLKQIRTFQTSYSTSAFFDFVWQSGKSKRKELSQQTASMCICNGSYIKQEAKLMYQ